MIYIVSGRVRSGTSMMMRSAIAGGLTGLYEPTSWYWPDDPLNPYHPNPNGFFEGSREVFTEMDDTKLEGTVTKVFGKYLPGLPQRGVSYNIVLMVRTDAEVVQSLQKLNPATDGHAVLSLDEIRNSIQGRNDFIVTEINYVDVINDPVTQFNRLVAAGWPIDANIAASMVDPSLYRTRI